MGLNKGYLTSKRTPESDDCFTPYYAVKPLVKYLEQFKLRNNLENLTIWTPCDASWSAYVNTSLEAGFRVIRTSLEEGFDFLNFEPTAKYDIIITNIPFSKKDLFLKRLTELKKTFLYFNAIK